MRAAPAGSRASAEIWLPTRLLAQPATTQASGSPPQRLEKKASALARSVPSGPIQGEVSQATAKLFLQAY